MRCVFSTLTSTLSLEETTGAALVAILGVLVIILVLWVARLEWRLFKLTRGASGKSLEGNIRDIAAGHKELRTFRHDLELYLASVEKRLRRSFQSAETLRFNPFKGSGEGGNQSFSLALLNEDGDGVVVSSLYTRERTGVYAKPIRSHHSEHELSEEEQTALKSARQRLDKNT